MNVYLARDTGSICLYLKRPIKSDVNEEGFFFFYDPDVEDDFLEIENPSEALKNYIQVGEVFEGDLLKFLKI